MKELMNRFKAFSIDNKLVVLFLTGTSVFLLVAYLLAAFRAYVNADAGYYLGTAELIHQGFVPYKDFSLGYTPLFFYALQIPRLFMGDYPCYAGYMLFLYLIVLLDSVLLAVMVKKITKSIKLAWFSGLVFLVLYYYLEGSYFILEAFSVCFGLVSILLLLGEEVKFWRFFMAGAFSALSFLSKQYGLLFAGVIGVMMLMSDEVWKKRLWNCLSAMLGFCMVLALFFLLFFISGLRPDALIDALSGSAYGGQSVKMYLDGLVRSFKLFPYLLFLSCLFYKQNKTNMAMVLGCVAGLLLASLQFYYNGFSHYFIYMLPFVLILNALLWKRLKSQKVSPMLFLLYFGVLFTAVALPMQGVYKNSNTLAKHDYRKLQIETANQLRQISKTYNCKSALCYWNTIQYYALCPFQPSAMEKYSFAFGYDNEKTYCERLEDADCFLVRASDTVEIFRMRTFGANLADDFRLIDVELPDGAIVFVRNTK